MSQFRELADLIGKAAPALATALGGPLAGGVVSILAEAFGSASDPEAVGAAIRVNDDPAVVAAKLAEAEARFKVEAEKAVTMRAQIDAHVRMMELDYTRGWFWGSWRPLAGWIATLFAGSTCAVAVRDMWLGHYDLLNQAGNLLMIGGPIMALAGIYSWGKSEERKAMAGGLGQAAEAIRQVIKGR